MPDPHPPEDGHAVDPDSLLDLAPLVGLDALAPDELALVEQHVAEADPGVADAFAHRVRATRETMATVSASTAVEVPDELRRRLLAAVEADTHPPALPESEPAPVASVTPLHPGRGRRLTYLAAAAVVALAIGAAGWIIGSATSTESGPARSAPEQIFSAPDLRSTTASVGDGKATVYYSEKVGAGVLVMTDVPPPDAAHVYQMWLIGPDAPRSAGTMTQKDVSPVTTAVLRDIGSATTLGFTLEPPGGSASPTSPLLSQIPLG
ncbi:anti-sigma factor [Gordonia sp. ABSL1-1]|uniref:anti-sigma factor n=1 Tax=Gordonia sp. ABSL1-1 TaxID=3053923 RepID=UPI00257249A7|nr:anti-sigma factor [Gordonia sp. ABSL1-1]MDL9935414.1 anti-sigma factor [Gordonia sp. ABSL1-1]